MGRMHTHRHGKSHSIRPATLRAPSWITQTPAEVESLVIKYAKDGLTPSQIGIKLRDQHSIPLIKPINKRALVKLLEENDLKPEMPEDLENIVNKAVGLQKHLKENRGDNRNVRSLELIEAKFTDCQYIIKKLKEFQKHGSINQWLLN